MEPSGLEHAITTLERLLGARVTLHDLDGRLRGRVPSRVLSHRTPRCVAAKAADAGACIRFDVDRVRADPERFAAGTVRTCHVGVREAVVGQWYGQRLAWVLFIGPLHEQDPDLAVEALHQLRARLAEWELAHPSWPGAGRVERGGAGMPDDRRRAIERWIAVHHIEAVGLDDLAATLGLSRAATSRAVKAATGRSLPVLLTESRIVTAQALLQETDLPVVDVALRAGFGDRAHFHRSFRAATGTSPGRWRKHGQRTGPHVA